MDTLLELDLTPVGMTDTGEGVMLQGGMRFRITQHLGSRNRPAGIVFIQRGQEFVDWHNHRFNQSPGGGRIAGLQVRIKFAIAAHLVAHRWTIRARRLGGCIGSDCGERLCGELECTKAVSTRRRSPASMLMPALISNYANQNTSTTSLGSTAEL